MRAKFLLCTVAISMLMGFQSLANSFTLDADNYLDAPQNAPEHEHAWSSPLDTGDGYHQEVCIVCNAVKPGSRVAHNFKGTGNRFMCADSIGNTAYREVCQDCGASSNIFLLIHGEPANYTSESAVYYHDNGGNRALSTLLKITYKEFKEVYQGKTGYNLIFGIPGSNKTNFADTDLGYVFTGGVVISGGSGTIDTLTLCGRPAAGSTQLNNEMYLIAAYLSTTNKTSATRQGFINFYKGRIGSNTSAAESAIGMSGTLAAYESMSDATFKKIIEYFYFPNSNTSMRVNAQLHGDSWMSHAMIDIRPSGVTAIDGNHYYPNFSCYDLDGILTETSGRDRTCLICGVHKIGYGYFVHQSSTIPFYYATVKDIGVSHTNVQLFSYNYIDAKIFVDYTLEALTATNYKVKVSNIRVSGTDIKLTNPSNTEIVIESSTNPGLTAGYSAGLVPRPYDDRSIPVTLKLPSGNEINTYFTFAVFKPYAGLGFNTITAEKGNANYWKLEGDSAAVGDKPGINCRITTRWKKTDAVELQYSDTLTVHFKVSGKTVDQRLAQVSTESSTVSYWQTTANLNIEAKNTQIECWVTDTVGCESTHEYFNVTNIDSAPPETSYTVTPQNDWARNKVIKVTTVDLNNKMSVGFNYPTVDWHTTNTSPFELNYTVSGNVDTDEKIKFFTKDDAGNLGNIDIIVRHIDNTPPKVTSVRKKSLTYDALIVTVQATDLADRVHNGTQIKGSGSYNPMQYYVTSTSTQPSGTESGWVTGTVNTSTGVGSCDISFTTYGTYYIWVKDPVGLVSDNPWKVEIKINGDGLTSISSGNVESTDYTGGGTPKYNTDYHFHPLGYIFDDTKDHFVEKDSSNSTTLDIYYRKIKYTIHYDQGIGNGGSMSDQVIEYNTGQSLTPNAFSKQYTYKVDANDGEFVGSSSTELKETWTFKNWIYKSNSTQGDLAANRTFADKESLTDNNISVKDKSTVTLTAQWDKHEITLPVVEMDGAIFLGWYSRPQSESTDPSGNKDLTTYRLGGAGEDVVLEGNYWPDSSKMAIYAWWNKVPTFADVYTGLFFEGQDISYADLLELVKVFDYDAEYQALAQSAVDSYFDEAQLTIDNKINDIDEKLFSTENEEEIERLEAKLEKLYEQSEFISEMQQVANEELKKRFLQPYVVEIQYSRDGAAPYDTTDHHGSTASENDPDLRLIDNEAKESSFWKSHKLNTSSDHIGDAQVTYQVTDPGISVSGLIKEVKRSTEENFDHSVDVRQILPSGGGVIPGSKITLEYTRNCQINFNYNPVVKTTALQYFTSDDLGTSMADTIKAAQYATDTEDSISNVPWWTHLASYDDLKLDGVFGNNNSLKNRSVDTRKHLQDNLTITGIANIRMNGTFTFRFREVYDKVVSEFVSPESDTTKGTIKDGIYDKSALLDELYAFRGNTDQYATCQDKITKKWYSITKADIYDMLETVEITFDTHDQWGKYASNTVTPAASGASTNKVDTSKAPAGYLEKYLGIKRATTTSPGDAYDEAVYQSPDYRTCTIIFVYDDSIVCGCGCGNTVEDCDCTDCNMHTKKCQCGCGKDLKDCKCSDCEYKKHLGEDEDHPTPFDPWTDTTDDLGMSTTRVRQGIRYIDENKENTDGSFWGDGYGSELIDDMFNNTESAYDEYSGEYEDRNGNNVPVTVKDHTSK